MSGNALLNGRPVPLEQAALAATDDGATRGDGAFETVGVWNTRAFRLEAHLQRLAGSLAALRLPPPDLELLAAEAHVLLADWQGDGMLRLYVTASGTRLLFVAPQPQRPPPRSLVPLPAPWIRPPGAPLSGAKTMSYAANMTASRDARAAGADEALLVSLEGWVLEGPTFAVLWVRDGVLHAPALDLGIVASVTRAEVLALAAEHGVEAVEGRWPVASVASADEVLVCSAVRELLAIGRVGERVLPPATPVRDRLGRLLVQRRRAG